MEAGRKLDGCCTIQVAGDMSGLNQEWTWCLHRPSLFPRLLCQWLLGSFSLSEALMIAWMEVYPRRNIWKGETSVILLHPLYLLQVTYSTGAVPLPWSSSQEKAPLLMQPTLTWLWTLAIVLSLLTRADGDFQLLRIPGLQHCPCLVSSSSTLVTSALY